MKHFASGLAVAAVACLICTVTPLARGNTVCDSPLDTVDAYLALQSTRQTAAGRFVGRFMIHNRFGNALSLRGTMEHGVLFVEYPEAEIQVKDVAGRWVTWPYPAGSFERPPDRLTIASGERGTIDVGLPNTAQISQAGLDLRIHVTTMDSSACIESLPFVALQDRGPVSGFESTRSNKGLERQ